MPTFLKSAFAELWKAVCSKLAILLITGFGSILTLAFNQYQTNKKLKIVEDTVFSMPYMKGAITDKEIAEDVMKPILLNCGMFSSVVWTQYNANTKYLHFKEVLYYTDIGFSNEGLNNSLFRARPIDNSTFEFYNNIKENEVVFIDKNTNTEAWNGSFLQDFHTKSWEATNIRLNTTLNDKTKKYIKEQNNGSITFKLGSLYVTTIKDDKLGLIYVLFLSLPNERISCYKFFGEEQAKFKTRQAILDAKFQIKNKIFHEKI